jgi:Asp-tRNA(Asn)/Glu-tRNA(Gln) amidotransferase C subunit
MSGLTAEDVARQAQAMGVTVPAERTAELAQDIQDMLAFVRELDQVISQDVMPATEFNP